MTDLSDLLRLCAILRGRPARNAYDWQAADAIEALRAENERLQRERDEASAKAIDEAAAAVTDAAAIVDHPSVYMGGPTRQAKWVAQQFADAILALREKPNA